MALNINQSINHHLIYIYRLWSNLAKKILILNKTKYMYINQKVASFSKTPVIHSWLCQNWGGGEINFITLQYNVCNSYFHDYGKISGCIIINTLYIHSWLYTRLGAWGKGCGCIASFSITPFNHSCLCWNKEWGSHHYAIPHSLVDIQVHFVSFSC